MASPEKKKPTCLYISQKSICEKILDETTRLEYIYRFLEESHKSKFIKYAIRKGGSREDAEDAFQESVKIIYSYVAEKRILFKCSDDSPNCKDFLGYVWKIMRNKFFDLRKLAAIMKKLANEDPDKIHPGSGNAVEPGINLEDQIKIHNYIYDGLDENDKIRYKTYFIDKLTHDEVVKRENIDIWTNASSRNTLLRLRNKMQQSWRLVINNEMLLDYVRYNYRIDYKDENLRS